MSKFALLILFLAIGLHWLSQPFHIDPNDAMINKYRPSLQQKYQYNEIALDSIRPVPTKYRDQATALHVPKATYLRLDGDY